MVKRLGMFGCTALVLVHSVKDRLPANSYAGEARMISSGPPQLLVNCSVSLPSCQTRAEPCPKPQHELRPMVTEPDQGPAGILTPVLTPSL